MAKMKMAPKDRPKVKVECLRLLATLKLNPAKARLIAGFVDVYLNLTVAERKRYERELEKLNRQEREATMEMMTSWEREGHERGFMEGKEGLLQRLLQRRFGNIPQELTQTLDRLTPEQMDDLGVALFDIANVTDVEAWVKARLA